jgi:hypothetical protein
VENSALNEALALGENVVRAVSGINIAFISSGVVHWVSIDVDVESSDFRSTIVYFGPRDLNSAFLALNLSLDSGLGRLLRSLMNLFFSNVGPFTSTASVDSTDLEQVVFAGHEGATVVSESESVRLGKRSELNVVSASLLSTVPDELVLKSILVVGSIPSDID